MEREGDREGRKEEIKLVFNAQSTMTDISGREKTDGQTDKQTDRQTDRQTNRQTERCKDCVNNCPCLFVNG